MAITQILLTLHIVFSGCVAGDLLSDHRWEHRRGVVVNYYSIVSRDQGGGHRSGISQQVFRLGRRARAWPSPTSVEESLQPTKAALQLYISPSLTFHYSPGVYRPYPLLVSSHHDIGIESS